MWNDDYPDRLLSVEEILYSNYGKPLYQTSKFTLDYSNYYKREMGQNLFKKFLLLDSLIHKAEAVLLKKWAVSLEDSFRLDGGRTVNVDPVLVDEYQVVALSKKDRGSRIYISEGVYGEMELFFHHGSFHPLPWTYIDYKENVEFFNQVRKIYLRKVREV